MYLNETAKIPDSVKVNAGVPQRGKSWTSPCYILKKGNIPPLPEEEAYVTVGPLHPAPPQAPRWMGVNLYASSDATPTASGIGSAMQGHGEQNAPWTTEASAENALIPQVTTDNQLARDKQLMSDVVSVSQTEWLATIIGVPAQRLKSVIIKPSTSLDPADPLVTIVPSLIRKVYLHIPSHLPGSFLKFLTLIDLNPGTMIPPYFHDVDALIHLAFILHPQVIMPWKS